MLSYSDYILSYNPFGYWKLNDVNLNSNNNIKLLDSSGQNHTLELTNSITTINQCVYMKNEDDELNFLSDSLQMIGIGAFPNNYIFNKEDRGYDFNNDHAFIHSLSTIKIAKKKIRCEFILKRDLFLFTNREISYPILTIGNMTLILSSNKEENPDNIEQLINVDRYSLHIATKYKNVIRTLDNNEFVTYYQGSIECNKSAKIFDEDFVDLETGEITLLVDKDNQLSGLITRRIIMEYEYLTPETANVKLKISTTDNYSGFIMESVLDVSQPIIELDGSTTYRELKTSFDTRSHYIAFYGGIAISNLSVFYDTNFDENYENDSLTALSNEYIPYIKTDIGILTNNVPYSETLSNISNSMILFLDTVLITGFAHRIFHRISVEHIGDDTKIILHINEFFKFHSFIVGDMITLEGCAQTDLNGVWRIDEQTSDTIIFTINGRYNKEDIIHYIKRAPIGRWSMDKKSNNRRSLLYKFN